MSKRTIVLAIGAILALVMGAQVAAFASHPLATLDGSNFEIDIDANLKQDHDGDPDPAMDDWATVTEIRATDVETGQNDDSYKGGVKETTECPAETTGSIPNNKSDLLTFHVYEEAGTGGDPGFMNLAWSRVSDPSGTTLMDFEFNQLDTADDPDDPNDTCSKGPNVPRTDGDLLIEYEIDQGGQQAEIFGRFWDDTTNTWGPQLDLDDGTQCDGGPCASGTINQSIIPAAESDGLGLKQPRTFGEAQIDLDLVFDPNSCSTFGSGMAKSRSSDADRSQLKDFIAPIDIDVSNCGKVIIHKDTNPETNPTTGPQFTFAETITTDPAQVNVAGTTLDESTNFQLRDNGTNEIANVVPGNGLTVSETGLPASWQFDSVDCTSAQPGIPQGQTFQGTIQPTSVSATGLITFNIAGAADVLECTYINEQNVTTLDTDPFVFPNDQATVTNSLGTTAGSVTFTLYGPDTTPANTADNCTGTVRYGPETINSPTNGVYETTNGNGATLPADFRINSTNEGTYWWKVSFDGTGDVPDVPATCNEATDVDVTDGSGTS